jgi:hypothetical protein
LLGAVLADILDPGVKQVCSVLHLELGPVDLTLLGLQVILDDCDGGPVVVDITAETGPRQPSGETCSAACSAAAESTSAQRRATF